MQDGVSGTFNWNEHRPGPKPNPTFPKDQTKSSFIYRASPMYLEDIS